MKKRYVTTAFTSAAVGVAAAVVAVNYGSNAYDLSHDKGMPLITMSETGQLAIAHHCAEWVDQGQVRVCMNNAYGRDQVLSKKSDAAAGLATVFTLIAACGLGGVPAIRLLDRHARAKADAMRELNPC